MCELWVYFDSLSTQGYSPILLMFFGNVFLGLSLHTFYFCVTDKLLALSLKSKSQVKICLNHSNCKYRNLVLLGAFMVNSNSVNNEFKQFVVSMGPYLKYTTNKPKLN